MKMNLSSIVVGLVVLSLTTVAHGQGGPPFALEHDAIQQQMTTEHGDIRSDITTESDAIQAEMGAQNDIILQKLDDLEERQTTIEDKIQEVLDILTAPCGLGTANDRFVPSADNTEVCDNNSGLRWQRELTATRFTWQDAKNYCASLDLGNDQTYELATLADYQTLLPLLAPALNAGPFSNVQGFTYWSATEVNAGEASVVFFFNGHVGPDFKESDNNAWCVRRG